MDTLITVNLLKDMLSGQQVCTQSEDDFYRTHAPRPPLRLARLASLSAVLVSLVAMAVDRLVQ